MAVATANRSSFAARIGCSGEMRGDQEDTLFHMRPIPSDMPVRVSYKAVHRKCEIFCLMDRHGHGRSKLAAGALIVGGGYEARIGVRIRKQQQCDQLREYFVTALVLPLSILLPSSFLAIHP